MYVDVLPDTGEFEDLSGQLCGALRLASEVRTVEQWDVAMERAACLWECIEQLVANGR